MASQIFGSLLLLISIVAKDFVIGDFASSNDDLVSVAVLFRHGDRSPKTSFPNDEYYNLTYWPMGFSQLTNQGKRRHYELGKWFRNRYNSFLPDIYSPDDIYVRSSDVDRTLMSAELNLAGLYQPVDTQVWTDEVRWQPVPVHTTPQKEDAVISMKKKCKKYKSKLAELDDDKFFKDVNNENKDLYNYLSEYTGWEVDDISFINDLQSIFYTYSVHDASFIPSWASNLDQDLMNYLAGLSYAKETYTNKLKSLKTGPFFNFLIDNFENIIKDKEDAYKFLMLSGHETTVAAVLNSMGVFDYLTPEFASTVIWELRRNDDGDYYINMFYKKEAGLTELTLDECQFNCDYKSFKKLLKKITLSDSDWEDDCKN